MFCPVEVSVLENVCLGNLWFRGVGFGEVPDASDSKVRSYWTPNTGWGSQHQPRQGATLLGMVLARLPRIMARKQTIDDPS